MSWWFLLACVLAIVALEVRRVRRDLFAAPDRVSRLRAVIQAPTIGGER